MSLDQTVARRVSVALFIEIYSNYPLAIVLDC